MANINGDRPIRERDIEAHLTKTCKIYDIMVRKAMWVGRLGCPDRVIFHKGRTIWVELKAPGGKPREMQMLEHQRMREGGADVRVIDSIAGVNNLINDLLA